MGKSLVGHVVAVGLALALSIAELGVAAAEVGYDKDAQNAIRAYERVALVMTGVIGPGSYRKFRRALARSQPEVIVLDGPGGILGEALLIGDEVRRRGIATAVGADGVCASACAIVFLSGRTKYMGGGAKVGLHAASTIDGIADAEATDIMATYLRTVGVPRTILRRMSSTSPQNIRWLTRGELRALGIHAFE
jgi:hypothetical protein